MVLTEKNSVVAVMKKVVKISDDTFISKYVSI